MAVKIIACILLMIALWLIEPKLTDKSIQISTVALFVLAIVRIIVYE